MRKTLFAIGVLALVAPFAALAADAPAGEGSSPAKACRAEQAAMGAFKALYGGRANAFGKCVAKKASGRERSHANAASACRAEQADTAFADSHGGKTFDQFYRTGKNGRNAFGKCVASKATESNDAADATVLSAVKQCRADRAADPAAFRAKYGKNRSRANAFGRCVSQAAQAKTPQP